MAAIPLRPTSVGVAGVPSLPHGGVTVTPGDDYFERPVAIYAGGAGVVNAVPYVNGVGGAGVLVTVTAGGYVPFMCVQVLALGTTATELVASF